MKGLIIFIFLSISDIFYCCYNLRNDKRLHEIKPKLHLLSNKHIENLSRLGMHHVLFILLELIFLKALILKECGCYTLITIN